ncbi:MAG: DNA polymerase IV [Desulfuromonadales bacterium]|nr:MAG: DNA polymerase IV [Desulfuromonadales bacterium]
MSHRTILHIDMNAFFASVEQQANPRLRGRPIAVTGSGARSIITTASYEARAFGVKTGMTAWEARRACPQLELVVGDNRKYTHTSIQINAILREYTPLVETFSIDEAFLDLSGSLRLFGSAERIAYLIKASIRNSFGLTCSIGIAPNKLLAKLASDMKKPDGLTVIGPEDVASILETVPIGDLCGIGPNLERSLSRLGVRTCGDLGRFPEHILTRRYGIIGQRLHRMGRGLDDAPVIPSEEAEEVKSVGHSTTLDRDVTQRTDILRWFLQLSEMVGRRARRHGVQGKTVTLTVRYADFTTFSRQQTLGCPTSRSDDIYRVAIKILDSVTLAQPVRLLGVRISNLVHQAEQLPLFAEERKQRLLAAAMDQVNDRFGEAGISFGSLVGQENCARIIAPAWRPEGVSYIDVL